MQEPLLEQTEAEVKRKLGAVLLLIASAARWAGAESIVVHDSDRDVPDSPQVQFFSQVIPNIVSQKLAESHEFSDVYRTHHYAQPIPGVKYEPLHYSDERGRLQIVTTIMCVEPGWVQLRAEIVETDNHFLDKRIFNVHSTSDPKAIAANLAGQLATWVLDQQDYFVGRVKVPN